MVDANLGSKIEVHLSAKSLPSLDLLSKSDPFCVIYDKPSAVRDRNLSQNWREIGRTETIDNNENPVWKRRFHFDYLFEEHQPLQFLIYDSDSDSKDLSKHDFIGTVELAMSEIASAPGGKLVKNIKLAKASKKVAQLVIHGEEVSGSNDEVKMELSCEKLDKKDWFGKSDPYVEIHRGRPDGSSMAWVKVHTTPVIKKTLDPRWPGFTLKFAELCNGDQNRPLKFSVFDWNKSSAAELIGECQTTLADLLRNKDKRSLALTNEAVKKKKGKSYVNSGTLVFNQLELIKNYSFLNYIQGGMHISLMVAIDFTGSNGNPTDPSSLHYRYGNTPNEYVQAIRSIGSIVAAYDTDQMFPVFGFGGKVNGEVNHCFPLTLNNDKQEVHGLGGILEAYNNAFNSVLLSGPTYFSQVIETAAVIASTPYTAQSQTYHILLIITDGVINDLQQTSRAIVDASDRPLSIIIVGVGGADFSPMHFLDGDETPLSYESEGKKIVTKRDIVQFVSFRDFKDADPAKLAAETLAEVPGQLLSFCGMHKIKPIDVKEGPQAQQAPLELKLGSVPQHQSQLKLELKHEGHQAPPLQQMLSLRNLHQAPQQQQPQQYQLYQPVQPTQQQQVPQYEQYQTPPQLQHQYSHLGGLKPNDAPPAYQ